MVRFALYFFAYAFVYILGMTLAPFLPAFAVMREGPVDNGHRTATEPRLPLWLAWFDTAYDNSLWGDAGWRLVHCPEHWDTYLGMVEWLWRNCACGFSWSVIAWPVAADEKFTIRGDLNLDKNQYRSGSFFIQSSRGAFQWRWVKMLGHVQLSIDAGWMLDVYVNDQGAKARHPRAAFGLQPQIKFKK